MGVEVVDVGPPKTNRKVREELLGGVRIEVSNE
jgi:hypothetical protein